MVRQRTPTPPNSVTPADPALVTPAVRPEVLLALQQTQAMQTLHNECASIRQAIGSIQADILNLKNETAQTTTHVSELRHLRSKIIGGLVVLGIVLTAMGGIFWYFVGPKWHSLEKMVDDYEQRSQVDPDSNISGPTSPSGG